jgi:RES domain-containing protein
MIVYRIIQQKYCPDWEGKGAELIGRRWNSKGVAMIYTSESRALSTVEVAVHINFGASPPSYVLLTIDIPDEIIITELDIKALPVNWRRFPFAVELKNSGDRFINENRFAVMKVPSSVVPDEFNYLLNPHHPDFAKIRIIKQEPFEFDERFFDH